MYQDLIKIIVSQKLITLMVLFLAQRTKIQRSNTFLCHVDTACSRKEELLELNNKKVPETIVE